MMTKPSGIETSSRFQLMSRTKTKLQNVWPKLGFCVKCCPDKRRDDVFNQSPGERNHHQFQGHHSQAYGDDVLVNINAEPGKQRRDDRRLRTSPEPWSNGC